MPFCCHLCPRNCGAARTPEDPGRCGAAGPAGHFRVASLMVHHWEEPVLSGSFLTNGGGSGTVFFSGCSLGCAFCQNAAISHRQSGQDMSLDELAAAILRLSEQGVHNVNFVTAGHYADQIPDLVRVLRENSKWQEQPLSIVWNSSAYETSDVLAMLADSIDIWLPDYKFSDQTLAARLAGAADYPAVARQAIAIMQKLHPKAIYDERGLMRKGLIIRHLVLPGHWRDSCRCLDDLADIVPPETPLSIMSQYTPQPGTAEMTDSPELNRRLTTYEYRKVIEHAQDLGFSQILGQERASATASYTPDFSSLWLDSDGRGEPGR